MHNRKLFEFCKALMPIDYMDKVYKVSGRSRDVWSPETQDLASYLYSQGFSANLISRFTSVPSSTISRWEDRSQEERIRSKKSLLKQWYNQLPAVATKGYITLERYLDTYGSSLDNCVNDAEQNLLILFDKGYHLPYGISGDDAYLVMANFCKGSPNSDFSMDFFGNLERLAIIRKILPFKPLKIEGGIRYGPYLGRLYHPAGMSFGKKFVSAPPDFNRLGFLDHIVSAVIDHKMETGNYHIGIRFGTNQDYGPNLKIFAIQLIERIKEMGIELTRGTPTIDDDVARIYDNGSETHETAVRIRFVYSPENARAILKLPLRYERIKDYLIQLAML